MKQIEKIAESENFSAIGLGKLSELNEFVLELNPVNRHHIVFHQKYRIYTKNISDDSTLRNSASAFDM